MATTRITAAAKAEFDALPITIRICVVGIFERLAKWPAVSGAKPLRGKLAGKYRIRTGDYRVQFHVDANGNPTVEKIGHRDGFYDE